MPNDAKHLTDRVKSHVDSKAHKKADRKRQAAGLIQLPLSNYISLAARAEGETKQFHTDLTRAFVAANIPIHKLALAPVIEFFTKYIPKHPMPSLNSLRYSEVDKIYKETINKIRIKVAENDIFMMIDETTDRCDRKQVNFLIGILDGEPFEPMLIHTEFCESCNAETIQLLYIDCCKILWSSEIGCVPYNRVMLLVTDQAAYKLKAGKLIKNFSEHMLHITCIAHALSRVAETVRKHHPTVDLFLANFKSVLKNGGRRADYIKKTGLALPPNPVLTRWTTWLSAAQYVSTHLEGIKDYLNTLSSSSTALTDLLPLFENCKLMDEFVTLHDFYFLIKKTKQIQRESMRIEDAWEIIKQVADKLQGAKICAPYQKFESSLKKNTDFEQLMTKASSGDDIVL